MQYTNTSIACKINHVRMYETTNIRSIMQYVVAFLNTNDIDFMRWTLGPYESKEVAEAARIEFIEKMDEIDEFSAVWEGDVIELRPMSEVLTNMGNILAMERDGKQPCNCEHRDHFEPDEWHLRRGEVWTKTKHDHLTVPAGEQRAQYVGPVCDDCAATCLKEYLIP